MALTPKQEAFANWIKLGSGYDEALSLSCLDTKSYKGVYYVYMLINPVNDQIFYVGKGKGKRIQQHAKNAIKQKIDNAEKHKLISAIHERGDKVKECIFFRTDNENDAYRIERELIHDLKEYGLTNIANGIKTNAELDLERAKSLRKLVTPLEWLEANPDKDFIKVFGGMREYYFWMHSTIDRIIEDATKKLEGAHA